MLKLSNLSLRRGVRLLLQDVNITIHPRQKVGITGGNGCGKSSLFALINNELHTDSGDFFIPQNWIIAHVAQESPATERPAIDYVIDGDNELRHIEQAIEEANQSGHGELLGKLYAQLEEADGYTANSRAAQLLSGLGFSQDQVTHSVNSFSGGWRMRLNLARALMCRSDLLLLDEPTNHLDMDAVLWLEDWLKKYAGTLLLISHDRDFLDSVMTHIAHIEHQSMTLYSGNYSQFERIRAEQLAQQQVLYERQQQEIKHIQSFINRFKAKATKAKQAQSRVKTLEKMELISQAHVDSPFHFEFHAPDKIPNPLVSLEDIKLGYGETTILDHVHINLQPGSRIGLLGHNGAGKSTFIKLLADELAVQSGRVERSSELRIGYFAQHQLEQLHPDDTPMEHFQRLDKRATEQSLRNHLGGFGFSGDKVESKIAPFSGGEKARLVFATLVYQKPNLLLLDEPTNHLDLDMRHAISLALQEFEGAMVIVSHDRHLLRSVTDEFYLVVDQKVTAFKGDLEDYRNWITDQKKQEAVDNVVIKAAKDHTGKNKTPVNSAQSKKEQKRLEAEKRKLLQPLRNKQTKLEKEMDKLTHEKEKIEVLLASPDIYEDSKKVHLKDLLQQQVKLTQSLDDTEEQWMIISEELESL
ncbi:MAG: ATP-binding cassette domain-containing protein [gamma proteobacterium symbiont of Bathyaustriella thionipta]|nr:ATP-binding cassette domain-containing protein [gamma proteobacterium symbiont of Bathyaustriella thionipta]MCU7949594.1 ATP-binding cassette domain-containing protein [gamma proteobacterium symbiont of Bathyaustriella thionipta]MCU7953259.1 ATP-binding cassette domain-containing protein [gamma proteobacterium symbiont of Bathyaustriella thionipta]MCU7956186.1 ATP-binding cassette domain-containing protein [gamma proteobacterium symbiont of Bathyaustriella thionipta]MCU7968849.1 ATP-binding 